VAYITLDTLYAVFYIIFAVLMKYILPTFHCRSQRSYKISSKYLNPRLNYSNFFEIQDGGRPLSWIFDNLILSSRSPWVAIFHHCTKFSANKKYVLWNAGICPIAVYLFILLSLCFKSSSRDLGHAPFWGHSSSTVYYFQQSI